MFAAGFADPVHDGQRSFRAILDALARPGTIHALPVSGAISGHIPTGLVSVLLTVADHDTPIWLADEYRTDAVRQFIGFHTGAPIVSSPESAQFAFASSISLPRFEQFNLGSQEYPDRSTTLVLALPSLDCGPKIVLRGPGIEDHWHISPEGLPEDLFAQWAANGAVFPRGIDVLLVADGKVMGLPRTVRMEEHR